VHTTIFCAVNVLALIRWGHPEPWSRLDRFSIAAILLLVGDGIDEGACAWRARSRDQLRSFSASDSIR
jgi:hypothetical protein